MIRHRYRSNIVCRLYQQLKFKLMNETKDSSSVRKRVSIDARRHRLMLNSSIVYSFNVVNDLLIVVLHLFTFFLLLLRWIYSFNDDDPLRQTPRRCFFFSIFRWWPKFPRHRRRSIKMMKQRWKRCSSRFFRVEIPNIFHSDYSNFNEIRLCHCHSTRSNESTNDRDVSRRRL